MWRTNIGGVRHTLIARWRPWTDEGELVLDTAIIKTWGPRLAAPDIDFEIEGHPAFLRRSLVGFDLYVNGDKIKHITGTLPHNKFKATYLDRLPGEFSQPDCYLHSIMSENRKSKLQLGGIL
jgi:hypothetical protein